MKLNDDEIQEALGAACGGLLGVVFSEASEFVREASEATTTACVPFTGAWNGAISIECTESFARHISALMFEMETSDLSEEEIRDAMGEVANVLAGTFKGYLPAETKLSLPTVAWGLDYKFGMPNAVVDSTFFYQCEGATCVVRTMKLAGK